MEDLRESIELNRKIARLKDFNKYMDSIQETIKLAKATNDAEKLASTNALLKEIKDNISTPSINPNEIIMDQQVITSNNRRVKKTGPSTYSVGNSNVPLKLEGQFLVTPQGNKILASEFMKIINGSKVSWGTREKYGEAFRNVYSDVGKPVSKITEGMRFVLSAEMPLATKPTPEGSAIPEDLPDLEGEDYLINCMFEEEIGKYPYQTGDSSYPKKEFDFHKIEPMKESTQYVEVLRNTSTIIPNIFLPMIHYETKSRSQSVPPQIGQPTSPQTSKETTSSFKKFKVADIKGKPIVEVMEKLEECRR